MRLVRTSCAKVNLLLNVLGRRADGFHELESVMLPVAVEDELTAERGGEGIRLVCDTADLPTDARNLVHRAAKAFLDRAGIREGVDLHLAKRMPLAAGLGGGSSNAAATLLLLSDLFDHPLTAPDLYEMGCGLGSDVPFFLEPGPALAAGRGESIRRLASFPALRGTWMFLVHPGFGVSTPWAYQALGAFPDALNGRPGRAEALVALLQGGDARRAGAAFYNALEAPVLTKYPLLAMFQDHLRGLNPLGVLMSGSGSTTFSLWPDQAAARQAESSFRGRFGESCWTAVVPVQT